MIYMKESTVKLIATLIFCLENVGQASAVAFAGPPPTPLRELSHPHTGPAPTIPPRIRAPETRGLSHRGNDPGLCGYVRGDTDSPVRCKSSSSCIIDGELSQAYCCQKDNPSECSGYAGCMDLDSWTQWGWASTYSGYLYCTHSASPYCLNWLFTNAGVSYYDCAKSQGVDHTWISVDDQVSISTDCYRPCDSGMTTSSSLNASSTAEGNSTSSYHISFPLGAFAGYVIAGILTVGILIVFLLLVISSCTFTDLMALPAGLSRPLAPILSNRTRDSPFALTSVFPAPSTRLKQPPLVTSPPTHASPPNHSSFSRPVSPLSATLPSASQAQRSYPSVSPNAPLSATLTSHSQKPQLSRLLKDSYPKTLGTACPNPSCYARIIIPHVPGRQRDCHVVRCNCYVVRCPCHLRSLGHHMRRSTGGSCLPNSAADHKNSSFTVRPATHTTNANHRGDGVQGFFARAESQFQRPNSPPAAPPGIVDSTSQAPNQEPSEQEKDLNSGLWGKICPTPTCSIRVVRVPGDEGDCGMLTCPSNHKFCWFCLRPYIKVLGDYLCEHNDAIDHPET